MAIWAMKNAHGITDLKKFTVDIDFEKLTPEFTLSFEGINSYEEGDNFSLLLDGGLLLSGMVTLSDKNAGASSGKQTEIQGLGQLASCFDNYPERDWRFMTMKERAYYKFTEKQSNFQRLTYRPLIRTVPDDEHFYQGGWTAHNIAASIAVACGYNGAIVGLPDRWIKQFDLSMQETFVTGLQRLFSVFEAIIRVAGNYVFIMDKFGDTFTSSRRLVIDNAAKMREVKIKPFKPSRVVVSGGEGEWASAEERVTTYPVTFGTLTKTFGGIANNIRYWGSDTDTVTNTMNGTNEYRITERVFAKDNHGDRSVLLYEKILSWVKDVSKFTTIYSYPSDFYKEKETHRFYNYACMHPYYEAPIQDSGLVAPSIFGDDWIMLEVVGAKVPKTDTREVHYSGATPNVIAGIYSWAFDEIVQVTKKYAFYSDGTDGLPYGALNYKSELTWNKFIVDDYLGPLPTTGVRLWPIQKVTHDNMFQGGEYPNPCANWLTLVNDINLYKGKVEWYIAQGPKLATKIIDEFKLNPEGLKLDVKVYEDTVQVKDIPTAIAKPKKMNIRIDKALFSSNQTHEHPAKMVSEGSLISWSDAWRVYTWAKSFYSGEGKITSLTFTLPVFLDVGWNVVFGDIKGKDNNTIIPGKVGTTGIISKCKITKDASGKTARTEIQVLSH